MIKDKWCTRKECTCYEESMNYNCDKYSRYQIEGGACIWYLYKEEEVMSKGEKKVAKSLLGDIILAPSYSDILLAVEAYALFMSTVKDNK